MNPEHDPESDALRSKGELVAPHRPQTGKADV